MIAVKWLILILPVLPTGIAAAAAEGLPPPLTETRPAWQLQDGKQALAEMALAMQTLNYQGTVAFLRNGKLEPMKYSHAISNGREQEHLESLNSPLREAVRETGKVSSLNKATQQFNVDIRPFEHSFLLDLPNDLKQLDIAYDIEMQGEENVAMLPAYAIAIRPKDNLRYARKVWLAQQWALPLKVVIYDLAGEVLEEWVFTEFEVKDTLPFIDINPPANAPAPESSGNPAPFQQAVFDWVAIPNGFKEVYFSRKPMRGSEQPVDHLLVSDGLASVSIYMEQKNNALPPLHSDTNGVQAINAVNFFSHSLGDFQLTVMGTVPSETIRLIADGVKLKPH